MDQAGTAKILFLLLGQFMLPDLILSLLSLIEGRLPLGFLSFIIVHLVIIITLIIVIYFFLRVSAVQR